MENIVYIGTAFALIFIIEGLLYALFPNHMRRMMAQILLLHTHQLKVMGISMVLMGVSLVYLVNLLT